MKGFSDTGGGKVGRFGGLGRGGIGGLERDGAPSFFIAPHRGSNKLSKSCPCPSFGSLGFNKSA